MVGLPAYAHLKALLDELFETYTTQTDEVPIQDVTTGALCEARGVRTAVRRIRERIAEMTS